MDIVKLVDLFKATLDPPQVEAATNQLLQIQKIAGFLPTVLKIITESSIELPIRQAANVFLKNNVMNFWQVKEAKDGQLEYSIHQQDKDTLKRSIIDAIAITNEDKLRNNLSQAIHFMIKNEFPEHWPELVEHISASLQTPEPNRVYGGLIVLLQLVKNYEYKNNTEKAPLIEVMRHLCPILYQMMTKLLTDESEESLQMQKTILKTFFIFVQYSLPLQLFTQQFFTQWMEVLRLVIDRPIPEVMLSQLPTMDVEVRQELPWFKAKKWALHIVVRVFERFGKPKVVTSEYKTFAKWYLETFSMGIIQVLLNTLAESTKAFYPGRIVQQCINYLNYSIPHNECWKVLKPHIPELIANIIFPLMCYTDEDDELWQDDQQEYIRRKFDLFEESISKVTAAQCFISSVCKRNGMLKNTIAYAVQVLSHRDSTPRQRDGALNMLGTVSEQMLKKDEYRKQAGEMLSNMVFPYFTCDAPFLRARAAWVLHFFDDYEFSNEEILVTATNCLMSAIISVNELPVKVEAAISLHIFILSHPRAKQIVEQNLRPVIISYLNIVKDSQNDDITNALQKLILTYGDLIIPISQEIIQTLVDSLDESNSLAAAGILSAIDTVLMMIEAKEVLQAIEPVALGAIWKVFNSQAVELYEEAFNIVTTLTDKFISPALWEMFDVMFKLVMSEKGTDNFTEMMSCLHNFITIDPEGFLANPNRVPAVFEMIKFMLDYEYIEDVHCSVLKIVEVFLLEYRMKIDVYLPAFVEVVLQRFMKEIKTEDLHSMCLQVLIVVFYISPELFFKTLTNLQPRYPNKQLIGHFLKEWLENINAFYGVHDRKVCLLALSKLLVIDSVKSCPEVLEKCPSLMTNVIKLFESLKEAYKLKANADNESSDSSIFYDSDEDEDEEIEEDEESKADVTKELKEKLPFPSREMNEDEFDTDSETDLDDLDDDYQNEMTSLESFETNLEKEDSSEDEYIIFRMAVEQINGQWYEALFGRLNDHEKGVLNDIFVLAQQRKDSYESRKIKKGGGYAFNPTVPINLNFGGSFTSPQ